MNEDYIIEILDEAINKLERIKGYCITNKHIKNASYKPASKNKYIIKFTDLIKRQ